MSGRPVPANETPAALSSTALSVPSPARNALGTAARVKIEALMGEPVYLELRVKVLPTWRRHERALKRLGYAT